MLDNEVYLLKRVDHVVCPLNRLSVDHARNKVDHEKNSQSREENRIEYENRVGGRS